MHILMYTEYFKVLSSYNSHTLNFKKPINILSSNDVCSLFINMD